MEAPRKKQSFLHGAALLAAAVAVVKFLGALYKIPLAAVIGDAGYSYFNNAYDIYVVLLTISTAGLPVAMSRMIAQANSLGNRRQIERIYRTATVIFLLLGVAGTLLMVLLSHQLAALLHSPDSWAAIQALGPAGIFMGLTAAYRGYFQGHSDMRPTSTSQILEAICRLAVGLGMAWYVMKRLGSVPLAAAGAITGVTVGAAAAGVYLYGQMRRARAVPGGQEGEILSYRQTAKQLLSMAVPITIGAAGLQFINLLDTAVVMARLTGGAGLSQARADEMKGIYAFTQTIINLPSAFISPITVSVIPSVTEFLTLKNYRGALRTEESALRVLGILILPCAAGLTVLARPVLSLLRGYSEENLTIAARMLAVLGVSVVFNGLVLLTNAMMQAHGHPALPVVNMLVGGIVKVAVNYILVGNPVIGIQGAPIGTLCCYVCITALNLYTMRRYVDRSPDVLRCMGKPILAACLMGGATFGAWKLLCRATASRLALFCVPAAVAMGVYALLVVKMKLITYEDCMLLPHGEKLAKRLRVK